MYTVYVIKSTLKEWFYVGLSKNVYKRLNEHNKGYTRSTKAYRPFKVVYTKDFNSRIKARDYEIFLKVRSNKEKVIK